MFRHSILLFLAISTPLASADPGRASANYRIVHETTTSASGGSSVSGDYTATDSGNAGGSESNSANYRHRDGFAGQLIDPVSLFITGADSVLESGTLDLDVDLVFDDDTVEHDVPAGWSVTSGPITSIDANGLVTPAPVFQNTSAFATAEHLGLSDTHSIVVIDKLKDNFGSYAADGLPDFWQFTHFGLDNPLAAPALDPDGDGQSNSYEYLAGFIPADASSALGLSLLTDDTIELSKIVPGTTYRLFRSTDLIAWISTGATLAPASPLIDQTITDPAPPAGARTFYKIDLED